MTDVNRKIYKRDVENLSGFPRRYSEWRHEQVPADRVVRLCTLSPLYDRGLISLYSRSSHCAGYVVEPTDYLGLLDCDMGEG